MKYRIITPENAINATVDSFSAAQRAINDTPDASKFLTSNLINNSNYIVERYDPSQRVSLTPLTDYIKVAIRVVDSFGFDYSQSVGRSRVLDKIERWASKSRMSGVRGERIAIISQPERNDLDLLGNSGLTGTERVMTVEAMISTAVIYNHRRATINVPRDQAEFEADADMLVARLQKLFYGLQTTVVSDSYPALRVSSNGNVYNVGTPAQPPVNTPLTYGSKAILTITSTPVSKSPNANVSQALQIIEAAGLGARVRLREISGKLGLSIGSASYKVLSRQLRRVALKATTGTDAARLIKAGVYTFGK